MRLKSFYAKTMSEAMQMVRESLGEDAIIVATRDEEGGRAVRVTAAIEPAFELGRGGVAAERDDWLQYDQEEDESPVVEEITDAMLRHSVPEDVMDNIISCATVIGLEQPDIALIAALEHLFYFSPLPERPKRNPRMLVGPPGSGKTLAVAKIAARAVMRDQQVGVITTDTVRAGGVEQLQAFTRLLDTKFKKAEGVSDLSMAVKEMQMKGLDHILIDTPGVNPFEKNDIRMLAQMIGCADMDVTLVLPGGGDTEEYGDIAKTFSSIGAQTLMPSRLDMTRRLGSILTAAHRGGLGLTDASNKPQVADGLMALNPKSLAYLLMPEIRMSGSHNKRMAVGGERILF